MLQTVWEKTEAQVADAIEDGTAAAKRAARRVSNAAEDLVDDTTRAIKRHPLSIVAAAFAIAFASGMLVGRTTKRG